MLSLLIVGAGGHGKVVAETAELLGLWGSVVFADDKFPQLTSIGKWPVVSSTNLLDLDKKGFTDFVVAVGDNKARLQIQRGFLNSALTPVSIAHPSAIISPTVKLGAGTVVFANAVINADTVVGEACIINTAASVDHDCVLGDGVHVSPGAHLAGKVNVGSGSWLGIGASVIQCINIGQNVIVGAGAAVVSDIPDGATAKGVPARF
ncbi:MAG: acetyltransferase [Gammaproteobacteria bacterium]|nr:acetyltransferase [Gammaproteobacteria bacterium]